MKSLPAWPVSSRLVPSQFGRVMSKGYWCWERRSAAKPLCDRNCAANGRPRTNCLPLGTCSACGSSCSSAPPRVQTTCFGCSRLVRLRLLRASTSCGVRMPSDPVVAGLPAHAGTASAHAARAPPFAVWGPGGALGRRRRPPTGPPGRTACRPAGSRAHCSPPPRPCCLSQQRVTQPPASASRATTLPRGMRCCRHGQGRKNASLGNFCEAGSIVLPSPVTSARARARARARALDLHLSHTDAASRALLLSQAGPHAARAFTVFPTSAELTVPSPLFRVLLLPVAPRACACHRDFRCARISSPPSRAGSGEGVP